jgi:hypothetical protein
MESMQQFLLFDASLSRCMWLLHVYVFGPGTNSMPIRADD